MSATVAKPKHLSISETALVVRQLAEQSGMPPDDQRLRYLARRLRTACEDGRVRYAKISGRYFFESDYVPAVADLLGLTKPLT